MKALLVDDSLVMRKVLSMALAQANITDVDQASDGLEAVEATKNKDYDLVLMDWNMPNMLGIDAVREIRAQGRTMPIILVTAEGEKARIVEGIQAGANDYIIKPFDRETVVARIQSVLAQTAGD